MTAAVMLSMLPAAIDSTIGKRPAAGAVGLARSDLDFDRFLVAMMRVRLQMRPDPNASLSKLIFDLAPPSHNPRLKALSAMVN